jgi:thioredoxin reductase (NADPH)
MSGGARLERVQWTDDGLRQSSIGPIRHVFVMAGVAPMTEWLEDSFMLDERGFIVTGSDILCRLEKNRWILDHPPMILETSVPGIFAVGDTRSSPILRAWTNLKQSSAGVSSPHPAHREASACFRLGIRSGGYV